MRHIQFALAILIALSTSASAETSRFALLTPTGGRIVGGPRVEVSASYSTGSDQEIDRVELQIDGKLVQSRQLDNPRGRGVCSFVLDATRLANGSHSLAIRLYSASTLLGTASGDFQVSNGPRDTTPPLIVPPALKTGQSLNRRVEIKIKAADDSGDPPLVSILVDGITRLLKSEPPYSFTWDTTSCEDGEHIIEAQACDSAGNRSSLPPVKVVVKNGPRAAKQQEIAQEVTPAPKAIDAPDVIEPVAAQSPPEEEAVPIPNEVPTVQSVAARAPRPGSVSGGVSPIPNNVQASGPLVSFTEPGYSPQPISEQNPTTEAVPAEPQTEEPVVDRSVPLAPAEEHAVEAPIPPAPVKEADPEPQPVAAPIVQPAVKPVVPVVPVEKPAAEPPAVQEPAPAPVAAPEKPVPSPQHNEPQVVAMLPPIAPGVAGFPILPAIEACPAPVMESEQPAARKSKPKALPRPAVEIPAGPIEAEMYGERFTVDVEISQNIPIVRLRQVWNHTGGEMDFDLGTGSVKAYSREVDLQMTMGSKLATVNGTQIFMDVAPYVLQGQVMVGVSLLQHAFRMEPQFDAKTQRYRLVVR